MDLTELSKVISIPLDEEQIRKISKKISSEPRTWNNLVKLFAETELRLAPAFVKSDYRSTGDAQAIHLYPFKTIELIPSYVREHPNESEIQNLAKKIATQNLPRQELLWFIAERIYTLNKVKELI